MSEVPAPATARKRPRGFETAGDMVRTMALVLGMVLVVFFLAARPQGDLKPPADVAGTVAEAAAAGLPVTEPTLPTGWKASNTRFGPDTAEGLPTWHVGYLDPQGQYGGISVTQGATPTWVQGVTGPAAVQAGTRETDGRTWQVWTNDETGGTTLVSQDDAGGVTTAVTSRGTPAALAALTAAAVAAASGAPAGSSGTS